MLSNGWLMVTSRVSVMVSVTVYTSSIDLHVFNFFIGFNSVVSAFVCHLILVGIVTMQLSERFGKEFGKKYEWTFWNWRYRAGAARPDLGLGLKWLGLGYHAGLWACRAGLVLGIQRWGFGTGASGLGLQGWVWSCRVGTWVGA